MARCGSMALYLMAVVVLVALFASSTKCRPVPAPLDGGSSNGSNAMAALNSMGAVAVNGSSGSSGGDVNLEWCLTKHCIYEGRGSLPCFCCAAVKPNACFETMDQCLGNCV